MLVGLQSVGHVVQVFLEGCYVGEDVAESRVEPCVVDFFRKYCVIFLVVCRHTVRPPNTAGTQTSGVQ